MSKGCIARTSHKFLEITCVPHVISAHRVSRSAYVDEHVEARYEEIINHLHKALSSTEQDEQDFKVSNLSFNSLEKQNKPRGIPVFSGTKTHVAHDPVVTKSFGERTLGGIQVYHD